jgi:hypothetical protein
MCGVIEENGYLATYIDNIPIYCEFFPGGNKHFYSQPNAQKIPIQITSHT